MAFPFYVRGSIFLSRKTKRLTYFTVKKRERTQRMIRKLRRKRRYQDSSTFQGTKQGGFLE